MGNKVTPTPKQRKALENLVENGRAKHPKPTGEVLRQSGYSKAMSEQPQKVLQSAGFQQLAEQYLPDEFLLDALKEDIEKKPQNRKAELELAYKIKGRIAERQGDGNTTINLQQNNLNLDPNSPEMKKIIDQTNQMLMDATREA